jgi:hypothetical protein
MKKAVAHSAAEKCTRSRSVGVMATVRGLIPSRRAISRCETPSAANARACAHSNALRTSRPSSLDVVIER